MLYDESTSSSLRPWLVRTLQPICDADPEALADYVLALLKHDAAEPELRKMFVGQLEEFLEKEASKFVDALFATLRTKSYLPYESVKADPPDGGIPIPFDTLMSSPGASDRRRKRSIEGDERDHPLPKGPRLGDGRFSRYSPTNGRMHGQSQRIGHNRGGQMNGRVMGRGDGSSPINGQMHGSVGDMAGHTGGQTYRPPGGGYGGPRRRGICRDYHNNGFCARGSLCQYSHGDDAVIPPMPYTGGPGLPGGIPFMPMFDVGTPFGGLAGGAYDPHESHMEMGPRHGRGGRAPIAPRPVDTGSEDQAMQDVISSTSGELPVIQDLTPRDPGEEATRGELPLQPNGFTHNFGRPRRAQPIGMPPRNNGPLGFGGMMGGHMGSHLGMGGGVIGANFGAGGMSGPMGGGGFRPPGRGSFTGENHSFRNGLRDDKTLVVEKIPEDKLSLETVNDWFKRFGTVTNVAIDSSSGKALISFSSHDEAHAAWKSEEAVFGNRFVKLFWHRPMEGQGGFGQRALAASAPLVKNMAVHESLHSQPHHSPPQPQPSVSLTPSKSLQKHDPATAAALAARQQLLEKQISEQKVLMSRLSTASSAEEKQEIMARIRSIQSEMKPTTTTEPQVSPAKPSVGPPKSLSEKERLDQELELHNATQGGSEGAGEESTNTATLREKLERLKAEASRIGVPEAEINAGSTSHSPYRPYRGRGFRARGYFRGGTGRGGPPRTSMKLDNRPRKLLIEGVPASDEAVQAVRIHYQNMGNMESFWTLGDGQVVVQFWSRSAAEQALVNGIDIAPVGKVKVSWHTGAVPAPPPQSLPANAPSPSDVEVKAESDIKIESEETRADHEDSGWGHSYDDEDEGRRRRSRSRSFS